MASDLERFFGYARAFEMASMADSWAGVEPYFTKGACHVVEDAGLLDCRDRGRGAVVDGLRRGALAVDRRFDVRMAEIIDGPSCRPDGIWMRFGLTFRRAGLPDLVLEGEHLATYEARLIATLHERLAPGMGERLDAYLQEHGPRLRPAGSPYHFDVEPRDRRDLERAVSRTLVRCYGSAKSRQDIGAALAVCSPDFRLETVCLDLATPDRDAAAQQLAAFFAAFPDYASTLHGISAEGTHVATWGEARMTFAGPFLGQDPTGRSAVYPCASIFTCADGMLRGERFFFDLATLCEQIGLPVDAVRDAVGPLREPPPRTDGERAHTLGA